MDCFAYFPSLIYREELTHWVDITSSACIKHYKSASDALSISDYPNSCVIQTYNVFNDPELGFLVDYFYKQSFAILENQGFDLNQYKFFISGMWAQELKNGGSHRTHVHHDSQISGFYFLETPDKGSYPIFHDPRPGKLSSSLNYVHSEHITQATQDIHFNNVNPGTFMFFNSWIPHSLSNNTSTQSTKFLHFTLSHNRII